MPDETGVSTTGPREVAKPQRTISDLLQGPELKAAVKAALPKHLTPERFIRVALNATMRTPKLLQCTKESFFKCLLDLSAYGLEADGRRAYLIPYGNECTLVIGYMGIVELMRRSGDVAYIHADVVYENDEWEFQYGSGATLKHKPNMEDRGERIVAVYSFVKLKDGSEDFLVMSKAEVEKIRQKSKAANNGPWVEWWSEMAKKSCLKRHAKLLPWSASVREVVEHDDEPIDTAPLAIAEAQQAEEFKAAAESAAPGLAGRVAAATGRKVPSKAEQQAVAQQQAAGGPLGDGKTDEFAAAVQAAVSALPPAPKPELKREPPAFVATVSEMPSPDHGEPGQSIFYGKDKLTMDADRKWRVSGSNPAWSDRPRPAKEFF